MVDEQRRLTFLRENVEQLEEEKTSLERVLLVLQKADENSAFEILRRLRAGSDIYEIVKEIHPTSVRYEIDDQTTSNDGHESGYIIINSIWTTRHV